MVNRARLKAGIITKNKLTVSDQLLSLPDKFFSSGCTVLDLVMGSGFPIGRIINVVGDKSTGKTLIAIEAMANFVRTFPAGRCIYMEAESAFDLPYAESLGFPIEDVEVVSDKATVEDFYDLLISLIERKDTKVPCLLVLDSLDALSDKAEKERGLADATYGTSKASKLSQIFRRLIKELGESNVTIIIISQVRDNIGVVFGRKSKRSGGRALDFYASIVLYLAEKKKRTKIVNKVKRVVGVDIAVKCDKNKVSAPFRECDLAITFGYGMEELESGVRYLESVNRQDVLTGLGFPTKITQSCISRLQVDKGFLVKLNEAVIETWKEVESDFTVKRKKY